MNDNQRFAMVITHAGRQKDLVEMPLLETEYRIDASDWIVLSDDGWRAVVGGEPTIWDALERKLLIGFYVSNPQLIAVIGHPSVDETDAPDARQVEVRQVVRRIRSLLLPVDVIGIWTDEHGRFEHVVEPADLVECEPNELQAVQ
jgi:hypothetical protein